MAFCGCILLNPPLLAATSPSDHSSVFFLRRRLRPPNRKHLPPSSSSYAIPCLKPSNDGAASGTGEKGKEKKKLSGRSSWEAKDGEGNDYLYRLGKEADNVNIAVGDDLFAVNFLGRDADTVFDYRQKVTRSSEYLQGD